MILKTEHYPERGIMYNVNRGVNTDGTKSDYAKVNISFSISFRIKDYREIENKEFGQFLMKL